MARNYAALPHDYLDEMGILSDDEFGRLCRALLVFSKTGETVQLPGPEKILLRRVILQEQRFQESYDSVVRTRKEAGKKGADKRWQAIANDSKAMANDGTPIASDSKNSQTETKTETETNTRPSNEGNKRAKRFTPPTLAEVQSYVAERHSPVEPQEFIDFYAAKGWMVGKTPMKDWKAACRNAETWERWNKKPVNGPTYTPKPVNDSDRAESMERMKRMMAAMEEG